jgi:hypothetical protein
VACPKVDHADGLRKELVEHSAGYLAVDQVSLHDADIEPRDSCGVCLVEPEGSFCLEEATAFATEVLYIIFPEDLEMPERNGNEAAYLAVTLRGRRFWSRSCQRKSVRITDVQRSYT